MDTLWKGIMRLNAKAFCLLAMLFFAGVAGFCLWQYRHPAEPIRDHDSAPPPEPPAAVTIGLLDFVTNQLTAETLVMPVDPFRPTIEAIFTNEVERAAFLKALKAAQTAASGISAATGADAAGKAKENPFAHLRKKAPVPGGLVGPDGTPLIIPKLTFVGFFERPDGKRAALFHDSAEQNTVFYDSGKAVHGVEILSANVREAEIRFPDGTTRKLEIGTSVELAPEPAKAKPRPAAKPGAKAPAAANGKAKPAAGKPGAAARGKADAKKPQPPKQKALQQKAVQPKAAQQKPAPQKKAAP